MNESKFKELVNLYFDREISAAELECLKQELATRADRRREFQARYRLHRAICTALHSENPQASPIRAVSTDCKNVKDSWMPKILFGLGVAACFMMVFAVSALILRESSNTVNQIMAAISDSSADLKDLENSESGLSQRLNLSSQLRLAGLTPDIAPPSHMVNTIDSEALRQRKERFLDVIAEVNRHKIYSSMPVAQLVEPYESVYESTIDNHWPVGFKSSLASFK